MEASNVQVLQTEKIPDKKSFLSGRKKWVILGVLCAAVILVTVFLFGRRDIPQKEKKVSLPLSTPFSIIGQNGSVDKKIIDKTATETADYIESQRNPDGSYNFYAHPEENCETVNGTEQCPFGGEKTDTRVNGWTALGNYGALKITGDERYQSRMERDLQTLYKWCDGQPPERCLWVLAQLEIIYKDTNDPELREFLSEQLALLLNSTPSTNIMLRSIEARELALGYEIFNDVRFLNAASIRSASARSEALSSGVSVYPSISPYPKLPMSACWYFLADSEIARVTADEELSKKTLNELNQAKVFTNFNYFSYPGAIQPCIEAYSILGGTLDAKKDYAVLMDIFMNSFYDNPKNKIIYGEGGTVFYPRNINKNFGKKYVVVSDTSYTLYLLRLIL